ncbi:MAG TPA: methylmalonyl-CoA epimerase [Ktedonobacterales bacterium]|jgi:methylmalonyl-CoA/ethylmalonyl-CoA epimerase|nr:methylmalonyl-CoA epimerase [Ktedonobacterales bacterium]
MLSEGVKRIDHVAIVVRDLESALTFYRDMLGIVPSRVLEFPQEGVRIAFLPLGGSGGSEIELLEPSIPEGSVARFLEQRGGGLHHICLEVPDIDRALDELRAAGARVLDESPRPTAEGRGIFLHPKGTGGVLLELVQRTDGNPEKIDTTP